VTIRSLTNPTSGIESIGRYETGRLSMPAGSDAQIVGGQVRQTAPTLYHCEPVEDIARSLIAPRLPDPGILQPNRFHAGCLEATDKMEHALRRKETPHAGLIYMRGHNERCGQVREKKAELTGA
jgi:hypothetical protein